MSESEVKQLWELTGGQPFLVRRAMDVLARKTMDYTTLMETADRDEGPFGDHLKRVLISVSQLPSVVEALRTSMTTHDFKESEGVHRLIASGIARQDGAKVVLMCELYREYLTSHLSA